MTESTLNTTDGHHLDDIDPGAPFPLTPMQEAYWIGRQEGQVLAGIGCHAYVELDGRGVDLARLRAAATALVRRHGMLRMKLLDDGRQQIMDESPWPGVTAHDLRGMSESDVARELGAVRDRLSNHYLDAAGGWVFDIHLSIADRDFTRLHVVFDLLAVDGHSIEVLLGDLGRLYADPAHPLPPLGYEFPHYLRDLAADTARTREKALRYWRHRLTNLPGRPDLPLACAPESIGKPTIRRIEHTVSADTWRRIEHNARARGVTPALALVTAYAETLGLWSGEPRFLLNFPLFNRGNLHPAVPRMVGDFGNFVLVAADTAAPMPFAGRAAALRDTFLDSFEHTDLYGVEVLRELTKVDPGTTDRAPIVFAYNIRAGDLVDAVAGSQLGQLVYITGRTPQVWIDHQVHRVRGDVLLVWEAVNELFPPDLIEDMAAVNAHLVEQLADADTWSRPACLDIPQRQQATRARVNDTAGPVPHHQLHEPFFRHAREHPERVALRWGRGEGMRYGDLADAARRVAAALVRRGVQHEDRVAVALRRGPAQIAAILGVLASGAAYVPLVDQPPERRRKIVRRAGVRHILIDSRGETDMGAAALGYADALTADPIESVNGSPDDLAYVMFTSGSTGEPKGVQTSHRAAANTIDHVNDRWGVNAGDRVLAVSSTGFDLSVYDIFGLLSVGGSVVLLDEEHRADPRAWVDLMSRHHVTVWNSVPAVLDLLLTTASSAARPQPFDVRLALLSGDWIGLDLPPRMVEATGDGCRLIALGGATEAAIWSNAFEVDHPPADWPSIPYGFPLRNQRHRVVDQQGRERPDWVPGELWIGGLGVARGYHGDQARTADRFVEHASQRWFRTGDLARYRPGGVLEFLGRRDGQVKIHGNRVELGEVEATLCGCAGVRTAVVIAAGDRRAKRLEAFLVPDTDDINLETVRRHVAATLPDYMVPSLYLIVDELPLTANGKIDRAALSTWASADVPTRSGEPPRPGSERQIAAEWDRLLERPVRYRDDNFFVLGGTSVLAAHLATSLRARFGAAFTVNELFTSPTVAGMAALLAKRRPQPSPDREPADVEQP